VLNRRGHNRGASIDRRAAGFASSAAREYLCHSDSTEVASGEPREASTTIAPLKSPFRQENRGGGRVSVWWFWVEIERGPAPHHHSETCPRVCDPSLSPDFRADRGMWPAAGVLRAVSRWPASARSEHHCGLVADIGVVEVQAVVLGGLPARGRGGLLVSRALVGEGELVLHPRIQLVGLP
jgi:hypothetical protein